MFSALSAPTSSSAISRRPTTTVTTRTPLCDDGKDGHAGPQPIMTCTHDDESAQKLADRLNKIK